LINTTINHYENEVRVLSENIANLDAQIVSLTDTLGATQESLAAKQLELANEKAQHEAEEIAWAAEIEGLNAAHQHYIEQLT